MTREELIEQEAQRLGQMYFPDESNIWARPNYEAQFVSNACMQMANFVKKLMIEGGCEWLRKNTTWECNFYGGNNPNKNKIEEYRKAMEEQL